MQEQNEKTLMPDSDLKDGKVRPRSKVKMVWLNSKHHPVPFVVVTVHPAFADKMIEEGKAREGSKLTNDEKEKNKTFLKEKLAAKGRTAGTAPNRKEDEDDGMEDLDLDKDLVGGASKDSKAKDLKVKEK